MLAVRCSMTVPRWTQRPNSTGEAPEDRLTVAVDDDSQRTRQVGTAQPAQGSDHGCIFGHDAAAHLALACDAALPVKGLMASETDKPCVGRYPWFIG